MTKRTLVDGGAEVPGVRATIAMQEDISDGRTAEGIARGAAPEVGAGAGAWPEAGVEVNVDAGAWPEAGADADADADGDAGRYATVAQVEQIVRSAIASLRVYVVESDITAAQNSVRAIVEQATF